MLKSFKLAFAAALAFFILGIIVGALYPGVWMLKSLADNAELSFKFIYLHNLRALAIIYLASIAYVGLALVLANGYALGTAVVYALDRGLTPLQVAAAIMPHGVFELPALLAASATGLVTISYVRSKKLKGIALIAAALIIEALLLAVAAFVETYITPAILKMLGVNVEPVG
jgi:stage II sporulation protein M